MEGWLSGRRHTTRNRAGVKAPRGFKSLPLRKLKNEQQKTLILRHILKTKFTKTAKP